MPILSAGPAALEAAARALLAGRLVALPTETVYGLGGDATDDRAVAAIFAAKGRPSFNPLIAHVTGADAAAALVRFDDRARMLAQAFWPGPLTLVLPRRANSPVSLLASAGLDSIAVRAPAHPVAQDLLRVVGRPVAAPSANRSGRISPTDAAAVAAELGDAVDIILDGGPCTVGVESTVLDLTGPQALLLRPGGVPAEELERLAGPLGQAPAGTIKGPGMLDSHYAPGAAVRLDATDIGADEALLAFGPAIPGAAATLNLSPGGDLAEAAANLFAHLRRLDASGARTIAVMPIPAHGLGLAINDRLRRAAAPR